MIYSEHTVQLRARIRQGLHAANLAHADTRPCDECDECLRIAHTAEVDPVLADRDRQIADLTAAVQRLRTAILEVIDGDLDPGEYPGDDVVVATLQSDWDALHAEISCLVPERDAASAQRNAAERLGDRPSRAPSHVARAVDPKRPQRSHIAEVVLEFHTAMQLPINDATRTHNTLRADLILEEAREAADALLGGSLEQQAKELADLAYVAFGAALTLGIDLDRAVVEVHASNMSKLVDGKPVMRPDGKVLKGQHYRPPDMSRCVPSSVAANWG